MHQAKYANYRRINCSTTQHMIEKDNRWYTQATCDIRVRMPFFVCDPNKRKSGDTLLYWYVMSCWAVFQAIISGLKLLPCIVSYHPWLSLKCVHDVLALDIGPVCSSAFHTLAAYFDLMRQTQRSQVRGPRSTSDPLTCAACFVHFHLVT